MKGSLTQGPPAHLEYRRCEYPQLSEDKLYVQYYKLYVQFGLPCFRLRMTEILCNFFRSVIVLSPQDLLQCVYLCLNKLAPAYKGVELGIGDTVLMKAIAQATGGVSQCACGCHIVLGLSLIHISEPTRR